MNRIDMKRIILLTTIILVLVSSSGCTNKYDACVNACMDIYESYIWNEDYIDCNQGCIDRNL